MKANELMIGDWVYKPKYNSDTFTAEEVEVDDLYLGWVYTFKEIPLTQEILEKNGFVVESRDYHGEPLQYCELVDGLWIDISGENYFEGKLEYVHQLQQALRLCGIKKEIEL